MLVAVISKHFLASIGKENRLIVKALVKHLFKRHIENFAQKQIVHIGKRKLAKSLVAVFLDKIFRGCHIIHYLSKKLFLVTFYHLM